MSPSLDGLRLLKTPHFEDERGWFLPAFAERIHHEAGIHHRWAEMNISSSRRGVIRGLHFQHPMAQAKIISVLEGSIWDVAVDLRPASPTYLQWESFELSPQTYSQIYLPAGFAHGLATPREPATIAYLVSEPYRPEAQKVLRWDDPALQIPWPIAEPILSARDLAGTPLAEIKAALREES